MAAAIKNSKSRTSLVSLMQVLIGNGGYVVLGFGANVIAADALGPVEFGLLSLSFSIMTVMQELFGSGVDIAMIKLSAEYWEEERSKSELIFRTTLQLKFLVNAWLAAVLWCLADDLAVQALRNAEMSTPLKLVGVGMIGNALGSYILAKFQAREQNDVFAVLKVFINLIKILLIWLLWYFGQNSVLNVFMAWSLSFFLCFAVGQVFEKNRNLDVFLHFSKKTARDIFRLAKWTLLSHLLYAIYSRYDFFILARYWTAEDLGNYSVAWNINFVIDLLTYSIVTAFLPKASRFKCRTEYIRYGKNIFFICMVLALFLSTCYLVSGQLITFVFPEFSSTVAVFNIIFWGGVITLLFHPLYIILYAKNKAKTLTYIDLSVLLVCLGLGLYYIPEHGIIGAAYINLFGRILSSLFIVIFSFAAIARFEKLPA